MPVVAGKHRRVGFVAEDILVRHILHGPVEFDAIIHRNLPQVRDAAEQVEFEVERLAAAVVDQPPAGQPGQVMLEREFPMHLRGHIGEDLRVRATPHLPRLHADDAAARVRQRPGVSVAAGANARVVGVG